MGRALLEKIDEGALIEYSVPRVRSYTTGDAFVLEDGRIVDGPLGVVISGDLTVQGTLIAGAIPAGAGGSDTQAQYNNAGNLAGSSGLILSATEVTAITLNSGLITGSGKIVLENDPVFLTRITSPELLGGSAVGSTLLLKSTSGVGSSDSIQFKVGNNGATEAGRFFTGGQLGLNVTSSPLGRLDVRFNGVGSNVYTAYMQKHITGDLGGGSASSSVLRPQLLYSATNPNSPFQAIGNAVSATSTYGYTDVAAVGTVGVFSGHHTVIANGHQDSERTVFYGGLRTEIGTGYTQATGPAGSEFAVADLNLQGPIAVQPGLLTGVVAYINNYYNGSPSRNGQLSAGIVVLTGPGGGGELDALHTAAETYPVDIGVHITGFASSSRDGFATGIRVGGVPGNWGGIITNPKIGVGVHVRDYVTGGLLINNRFVGATGYAIAVDAGNGDVAVGHTAPTAQIHIAGTYTTSNQYKFQIGGTLASSNTSQQAAIAASPTYAPSGASLSNIFNIISTPFLNSTAFTVNQFFAYQGALNIGAGFSGSVTTGAGFAAGAPTIGGNVHVSTYNQFLAQANTSNGAGITSGTVTNNAFNASGGSSAPGSGGTVTHNSVRVGVPSSSPGTGGVATNRGVFITGNGGSGLGAITNWALYSDSTTNSYFSGNLQLSGVALTSLSYALQFGAEDHRIIGLARNPTPATAGKNLTLKSGDAVAGTNNLNGGDLVLQSGISTGTGFSGIKLRTPTAGGSGSSDNSPATIFEVGNAKIAFFGVTAVIRQSTGVSLTNNLATGGSDDVLANYTDLTIYANDAASIRNNLYQLGRKLKLVDDVMRSYGLVA